MSSKKIEEQLERHRLNWKRYDNYRTEIDFEPYFFKNLHEDDKKLFVVLRDNMNRSFKALKSVRNKLPPISNENNEKDFRCPCCGLNEDNTHPDCPNCGSDIAPTVMIGIEMDPNAMFGGAESVNTVCPDCRYLFGWTL